MFVVMLTYIGPSLCSFCLLMISPKCAGVKYDNFFKIYMRRQGHTQRLVYVQLNTFDLLLIKPRVYKTNRRMTAQIFLESAQILSI